MTDLPESLDLLVDEGHLTPIGTPRCQWCAGKYGARQCPNEGDRIAVTTMFPPHLTIRVCSMHADELQGDPGGLSWGVRL